MQIVSHILSLTKWAMMRSSEFWGHGSLPRRILPRFYHTNNSGESVKNSTKNNKKTIIVTITSSWQTIVKSHSEILGNVIRSELNVRGVGGDVSHVNNTLNSLKELHQSMMRSVLGGDNDMVSLTCVSSSQRLASLLTHSVSLILMVQQM